MDIEAIWTAIGKYVSIWIAFIILIMSITACGRKDTRDIVSEVLSLDASGGSEILNYDTHSGNGDGTSCIVLHFKEDAVLKEIQENKWNAFPLDETVKTLVYGTEDGGGKYGPYLTDQDGNPLIPEIRNGYYRLIDRQIKWVKHPERIFFIEILLILIWGYMMRIPIRCISAGWIREEQRLY